MTVTIAGSGPAVTAVEAALTDIDHDIRSTSPDDITGDLAIVVGRVGSDVFSTANATARESGTAWFAVELGGVGGYAVPSVEAAVSGFSPETGCFDCLRRRVAANLDTDGDAETDTETDRFAGALAGRESVRVLSGPESPVLGGIVEIPHAIHRFLPVPNCECAGERDWTLRREHDERTLDDALERAEQALDDRVGLVNEVGEAESFPVPYYLARLCDTSGFSDVMGIGQAAGVALGWDEAFMKALGEGLERYSASVYRTDALRTARPTALPSVAPSAFVGPEGDRDGQITWVPGENLSTDESMFLPASRVFFPYDAPGPTITTGLGLGNSGSTALIAGLTEIIERDAALLAWYSTYEPLGLSIDDEEYETLVARAGTEGLSVTATLLTQDIDVPVVGVAVHRAGEEWPAFAMGLAADFDPVDAARAACCEALQNWMELRGMGRAEATTAGGRVGHFASRPASIDEFVSPETTIPASSITTDIPTGADALDALVRRITDVGLDVYAARLTPPDVNALGFEAVRALIPRAQPLFVDEPYFGERAETIPEKLGFESRLRREHHPYP
jgi:ribosomal protein S12 methylthiotransferase accessory factor